LRVCFEPEGALPASISPTVLSKTYNPYCILSYAQTGVKSNNSGLPFWNMSAANRQKDTSQPETCRTRTFSPCRVSLYTIGPMPDLALLRICTFRL